MLLALSSLSGCAHDRAGGAEVSTLQRELRLERQRNEQLRAQVAKLEADLAVAGAKRHKPAEPAASQVPELAVVKLKPKAEPAPGIDTEVAVIEPADDAVVELGPSSVGVRQDDPDDEDAPAAAEELLEAQYNEGMVALKTGNLEGGALKLQAFAASHGKHAKADNALYFAGVGLMGIEDFQGAAELFDKVLEAYPAGDATLDSMLKLAECRGKLNQPAEARALYSRIVQTYPGTVAASQAQTRLASLR